LPGSFCGVYSKNLSENPLPGLDRLDQSCDFWIDAKEKGGIMSENKNQSKQALLVIDVQKGLFERATPIYEAEQVLENINTLIHKARQEGVPVIFIQHSNDNSLVKGSDAWQLHPEIQPLNDENIIHKIHGNAFVDTNLSDELEKRNVRELVVTGLVTHGCVRATSLGAIDKGYKVVLVGDGHSNFSKDAAQLIEKWNRAISEKGAELTETKDVSFS
jgi:nicotinamidase-related amidase